MAFLPFLSGLAEGTSEAFGKISEENRKNKTANNKLVADSILERLKTDDGLQPEEQTHLLDQYLDLHGVDKKTKQAIIDHSGYARNAIAEHTRKQATESAQATMAHGPAQLSDTPMPTGDSLEDLPTFSSTTHAFAPAIPQFQPKSAGQLKFEESEPRKVQGEKDAAAATREAQRAMATGEIDDKIAILGKYKGSPFEDDVRRIVGAAPKGAGAFTVSPSMRGEELMSLYQQSGRPVPADVKPHRLYKATFDSEKKPVSHFAQDETAVAGGDALGSSFVNMFQEDAAGNPVVPGEMYTSLHAKEGGALIGIIPKAIVGSVTDTMEPLIQPQADGSSRIVMVPKHTTNQKTVNGAPVANGPQVPSMPVGAPGASATAAGGPQTGFGSATPKTPLPTAPSGLGTPPPQPKGADPYTASFRPGSIVGAKALSTKEFENLQNAKEALKGLEKLKQAIKDDPSILAKAALPGKLGARDFERTRGNIADVITRLRTGAALNEQEEKFYINQLPGLLDQISQHVGEPDAVDNAFKLHEDMFNSVVQHYGRRAPGGDMYPGNFDVDYGKVPKKADAKSATPNTALPNNPTTAPDKDEIRRRLRGGK